MKKNKKSGINIAMFIITLIGAIVAWIVSYFVYGLLLDVLPGVLLIPVVCTAFLGIMGLLVLVSSQLLGYFSADLLTGYRDNGRPYLYLLAAMAACFALMLGLEALYELDVTDTAITSYSNYVFVVDDSGSMYLSDPDEKRYDAIKSILEQKEPDTQYMVYAFADAVDVRVPMQTVGQGVQVMRQEADGGTMMGMALERVINDYEQKAWQCQGGIVVVLITDGYASDIDYNHQILDTLKRFNNHNIAVSTIGLGSVDRSLMQYIAQKTGGRFTDVASATGLYEAVEWASAANGRNLLSMRAEFSYSAWLGILRVVAITLYGLLFSLVMILCYGEKRTAKLIMISGAIKAFLGALLLELGLNAWILPEATMTFVCMVLIGTLICMYYTGSATTQKSSSRAEQDSYDNFTPGFFA